MLPSKTVFAAHTRPRLLHPIVPFKLFKRLQHCIQKAATQHWETMHEVQCQDRRFTLQIIAESVHISLCTAKQGGCVPDGKIPAVEGVLLLLNSSHVHQAFTITAKIFPLQSKMLYTQAAAPLGPSDSQGDIICLPLPPIKP